LKELNAAWPRSLSKAVPPLSGPRLMMLYTVPAGVMAGAADAAGPVAAAVAGDDENIAASAPAAAPATATAMARCCRNGLMVEV